MQENVKAIERQLNLADEMLIAATVLFEPEVRIEKGLPLIEILEELDDDGNVLCMEFIVSYRSASPLLTLSR